MVDAVFAVSIFVVIAVPITADLGGARGPDAVAYLFAVCLGALMFVRRRFPLLALVATAAGLIGYYMADYPPIGLAIPVAAALYSAAEAGKARAAMITAVGLVLVTTTFRLLEGDDPGYLLGYELASTVAIMAAAIALGDGLRSRHLLWLAHQRSIRQAATEREREARRRAEEERLRIARDVHDVLGHSIAVISVQASVADEALADDPAATRSALSTIRQASDQAVRELRATVGLLRDSTGEVERAPAGSLRHLSSLVSATSDSGLPVTTRMEGAPIELPAVVDSTAYRIVQESLANSLRHAGAQHADVLLHYEPDRLTISIVDDGRGHPNPGEDGASRGIQGMRERAALLGGRVQVSSRPGAGFRVDAELPLEVSS
ncbi:MAG: sensor histidine kinase [Pseudonocardiaceae bacterium]|nr:sensor histidine kinase [Pseudonocardiaceae bacterium]